MTHTTPHRERFASAPTGVDPVRQAARDAIRRIREKPASDAQNADLDKLEKPCRCGTRDEQNEARETMRKRARSKWITSGLLDDLEALDSEVPYDRARSCCETVVQEDGTLTSSYCRCRWCIVCNRIRMGTLINRYEPIMQMWRAEAGVFMVTLTVPNVEAGELGGTIREMKKQLRYSRRSIRETRGLDYRAVENWEVTHNAKADTYHPHVHCLVRGKKQALALREEHLKRWPDAVGAAQDVRMWDGKVRSLIEGLKYCTKLMKEDTEDDPAPPAEALDVIFRALYRKHLCNPAGFDLEAEQARARGCGFTAEETSDEREEEEDGDDFEDLQAAIWAYSDPQAGRVWTWDAHVSDWIDHETGECLAGWSPDDDVAAKRRPDAAP